MTLMEQIKTKQIAARKAGSAEASLLTTLLGEAAVIGKNAGNRDTTDSEVVAVVKKFVKNIDETISALTSRNQDASAFLAERSVLEQFLPKQLTMAELEAVATGFDSMPAFMKHMKENFAGQYDGKVAAIVAKAKFG